MNKKASIENSMIIFSFVLIGFFVLGAMATQTSSIFNALASDDWGLIGFVVKYFNIIMFVGLTLTLFVAFGVFNSD